ncbi:DUF2808 domain-containing protein [Microcoleus sp. F8-D3]|uniref:DUF2808 domain-containing protein n=1 Tax=Phormidium nigroviride PCC 7112 TaxID=179408 RepID=K9VRD2_9CYAN|nr:DUF2808 domain-containing protein [Oscillatoria nigro-viridis]AFZ10643.1 hypothetical protein Osc7112_6501 [Oscillatoria nigro-viridis PCC 7112]
MIKTLIYAAVVLAIAVPISTDYASARTEPTPHIDGSVQFPPTRARNVRHTIRVHIPQRSSPLSQMIIDVPTGLRVRKNITVTDNSGREINTNVSINDNKLIIDFNQPVSPELQVKIDLNDVKITGISNAWLYRISAKFVGNNIHIPIGIAQIRVY